MNTTPSAAGNLSPKTLTAHFTTTWTARLLVLLVSMSLPAAVQAQFNYTTENGQITITGYTGPSGAVDIPSTINGLPVTRIGNHALIGNTNLTSVTIPNGVTTIGDHSFNGVASLNSLTIPNSITSIGNGAFANCGRLMNVTIPSSVARIGTMAFFRCTSLTAIKVEPLNTYYSSADGVLFDKNRTKLLQWPGGKTGTYTIPISVTNIGHAVFAECIGLTGVVIGNRAVSIERDAFNGCARLSSVTIADGVINIGDSAFANCTSLTSVTIPNSVTSIDDLAFASCTGLTNVTIPNSVASIGASVFSGCTSLIGIMIPSSVTRIEAGTFAGCCNLTNVTIPNSIVSIGKVAFADCTSLIGITIPNGVTRIEGGAFAGCTSITSVTIPNSVTNIGPRAFANCTGLNGVNIGNSVTSIGYFAFRDCISLTGVYFYGNAPDADDGGSVFDGADMVIVFYLPGTTGWGASFADRPTALWSLPYPMFLSSGPAFGAVPTGFGFLISWATNASVVVEASPSLATPVWTPVSTNILTAGTSQFTDPQWTSYPIRLYRLRPR